MKPRIFHYVALVLLFAALLVAGRYLHAAGIFDPAEMQALVRERPLAAVCLFAAIYAVCVMSFVPTLPLNLAAGLLWGGVMGGLLTALGATLGSIGAFLVARRLLGPLVVARMQWLLPERVRDAVDRLGWRAVAFCRLNPAVPTCVVNYAFGVTSLPLRAYAWATFFFFLPATLAIAVVGEQSQVFIVGSSAIELIDAVLVTLASIATLLALSWIVRAPRAAAGERR